MMRIVAPCRLGGQFEHTKTWGAAGPLNFVGLGFFAWHCCGFEGYTVCGSKVQWMDDRVGFFGLEYLVDPPISFEVPYAMIHGDAGVSMREFGLASDKTGWLYSMYLNKDGDWRYCIVNGDHEARLAVRTDALDKLFAPILPHVRISAVDFL